MDESNPFSYQEVIPDGLEPTRSSCNSFPWQKAATVMWRPESRHLIVSAPSSVSPPSPLHGAPCPCLSPTAPSVVEGQSTLLETTCVPFADNTQGGDTNSQHRKSSTLSVMPCREPEGFFPDQEGRQDQSHQQSYKESCQGQGGGHLTMEMPLPMFVPHLLQAIKHPPNRGQTGF